MRKSRTETSEEFERKREKRISDYKKRNALNVLETKPKKYRFISFDTETITRKNEFYMCGVIDYNGEYQVFYKQSEVIDFFRRIKHNDVIVFATNLDFDFSAVFKDSPDMNKCEFVVNNGRFIIVNFAGTYNKIRFMDTVNFGSLSVDAMGKILGKPKMKHPRCLGKKPKSKKEEAQMVAYNKRDCEITRDFMIFLQDAINDGGGELRPTISSCALDNFRRKFMDFSVTREEIETGIRVKEKVYSAYYGGRTEAFARGKIEAKDGVDYMLFDVNSLYPSVMINKFPVPQSVKYYSGSDLHLLAFEGVSWFKLEIPYSKYPLLPFRKETKLIFPYGRFMGYYTHLEIREAIRLYGKQIVVEMKDSVYYTESFPFFKKYVEFHYNRRLELQARGEMALATLEKLYLNSLYGKFATKKLCNTQFFRPESNEDVVKIIESCPKSTRFNINMGEPSYSTYDKEFDGIYSLPIWSCYVSAYAKILMHKYILETEPLYTDTDSLITTKNVKVGKGLGEIKMEEIVKKGVIIKPKAYFLNDRVKFKGIRIPKDEDVRLRSRRLERLKRDILRDKVVRFEKFVRLREGIKRHLPINSIIIVQKRLDLEDSKRDWNGKLFNPEDLQQSEPLKMEEW